MIRSRVTLASTDAAAMQAATRSPFQTARPGTSSPSTGNPSVSTYAGRRSSRATARRSASTLATCMPSRSHSVGLDHHHRPRQRRGGRPGRSSARGPSRSAAWSRRAPGRSRPCPSGRITAPATSGPAQAPAAGLVDAGDRVDADPAQRALVAVEPGVAAYRRAPGQLAHAPLTGSGGVGDVRERVGTADPAEVVARPEQDEDLADHEVDGDELVPGDAARSRPCGTCGRWSRPSGPGCRPSRRCGPRGSARRSSRRCRSSGRCTRRWGRA